MMAEFGWVWADDACRKEHKVRVVCTWKESLFAMVVDFEDPWKTILDIEIGWSHRMVMIEVKTRALIGFNQNNFKVLIALQFSRIQ